MAIFVEFDYTERGGFSGNLTYVYDNYRNVVAQEGDDVDIAKAIIIDPNNALITQYNPEDIDDPYTYRTRKGFIGIEMWPGQDNRVYMQGHVVIPNDWGNVSTNGETTTTTDDTTDKDGGDDAEPCGELEDDCEKLFRNESSRHLRDNIPASEENCKQMRWCRLLYTELTIDAGNRIIRFLDLEDLLPADEFAETLYELWEIYWFFNDRCKSLDDWWNLHKDECEKYGW